MIRINSNKNIFLVAFVLCMIFVIAKPATTYAATASTVGVVNYQLLIQQHPDMAQVQGSYNAVIKQARDDFNTKSENMNDNDKKMLFQQLQQSIQQKQQELLGTIREKINVTVKEVADSKGLTIVMDKNATVYGGQDITDEVMKKIKGK